MQLYPPDRDDELIQTSRGKIKYRDFLEAEKKRIEKNPKRVAVLKSRLGFSWLMVNKIAFKSTTGQGYRQFMPHGQRKVY